MHLCLKYQGRLWKLREPETTLGRSRACDIIVGSPLASRVHVRLRVSGGKVLLTDVSSRNGTTLNGEKVSAPAACFPGDCIGVGSDALTFVELAEVTAPASAPSPPGDEEITRSVREVNLVDIVPLLLDECMRPGRATVVLPQLRDAVSRFLAIGSDSPPEERSKLRGLLRASRMRIDQPEFQTWVENAISQLGSES